MTSFGAEDEPQVAYGDVTQVRRFRKDAGEWGWLQWDNNIHIANLHWLDEALRLDWYRITENWVRRIYRQMQNKSKYQTDGMAKMWHQEVRVDADHVRGSLYNSSPYFKYVENDTAGADTNEDRKFPPWNEYDEKEPDGLGRIWKIAESAGKLIGKKYYQQRQTVYLIARRIYGIGTDGQFETAALIDEREHELIEELDAALQRYIRSAI